MKNKINIALIIAILIIAGACKSTKFATDCSTLKLDLYKGKLNNTVPTASPGEVKAAFTCFTGESEEGVDFNRGGGVFFNDDDFFFYTYRDYIEIRSGFRRVSIYPPMMGASMEEIEEAFGIPVLKPDDETWLYEMPYGTLRFEFNYDFVNKIGVHARVPGEVEL